MKTALQAVAGRLFRAPIPLRLEEAQDYFEKRLFDKEREVLIAMAQDHHRYFLDSNRMSERKNLYTLLIESYEYDNELGKRLQSILQFRDSAFPFDSQFIETSLHFLSRRRQAGAAHFSQLWLAREPQDRRRQVLTRIFYIRNRSFSEAASLSRALFQTEEDEFLPNSKGFLGVFTAQSQHEYIRGERCECGGWFDFQAHTSRASQGLSECLGKCTTCGQEKVFLFSIENKTFWKLLFGIDHQTYGRTTAHS